MEHVRWLIDPTSLTTELGIKNPVMVVAFTGWNDAGDAASTAVRTLVTTTAARALAEIDPEVFTDFATVRPHVRLDESRNREIAWPTVGVWATSLPGTDVILMLGPEPALRWRLFSEQIIKIAQAVGATTVLTLGALLADVPHTRPTHIVATASDDLLNERFDLERSTYEGPTGIVGVVQHALGRAGIPTASLWAAVPGYAAQVPSPRAAIALIERACSMMGTPAPISALNNEVNRYDAQVAALIDDDDDLTTYVGRLEAMADEMVDDEPTIDDADPEQLAAEVEQFLRDRDGNA
ncbi:MAG TPA: PAC2 family protein [Ilumatobacter sp.]|nr:PAC2 family protein [Ilumatobacter sp.]